MKSDKGQSETLLAGLPSAASSPALPPALLCPQWHLDSFCYRAEALAS